MASPLVESIQKDLEAIDNLYAEHFAGQSRATRDLARIDELITKSKALLQRIQAIPAAAMGQDLQELRAQVDEQVKLYVAERDLIQRAKTPVPGADQFAPFATVANLTFAKYRRHFAGKNRSTRDLRLIEEMVDDLKKIEIGMKAIIGRTPNKTFSDDLDIVRQNLTMYEGEAKEVKRAHTMGTTEERAGGLAQRANDQFALYREHFAGKSRASRRPQLLARVIANLEEIDEQMRVVSKLEGVPDFNENNIKIVGENLNMYRLELIEVRNARETTKMEDLMGLLGDAANNAFADYREKFAGKSRASVNRDDLVVICDQLDEIHRQMRDLGRVNKNETNANNLTIVQEQLVTFNQEYDEISKAQNLS